MLVSNRLGPAEWPGFFLPIHWLIPALTHQLCIKCKHKLKGTSKYLALVHRRGLRLHPLLLPQWVSQVCPRKTHIYRGALNLTLKLNSKIANNDNPVYWQQSLTHLLP
jgi:hypothetical protein